MFVVAVCCKFRHLLSKGINPWFPRYQLPTSLGISRLKALLQASSIDRSFCSPFFIP